MIFIYNKEHVGDVLMIIVKNSGDAKLDVERKGKVARVFLKDNGETVAWNIFEVSSLFKIAERGQVFLSDEVRKPDRSWRTSVAWAPGTASSRPRSMP